MADRLKIMKRGEIRYDYPKTIEYTSNAGNGAGIQKAVVVNISRSGICLYIYSAYTEGQTITIKSSLPVEFRTAAVRWVKKIDEGFYKSGMQFIE